MLVAMCSVTFHVTGRASLIVEVVCGGVWAWVCVCGVGGVGLGVLKIYK